jgi:tetratricopeptide (TPR) repeat protein
VHLLYRRNTLTIQQPHSVPLQFLSDTGIIGALLAVGGYALLLAAASRSVRRMPIGRQRLAAAALLAGVAAYAVHSLYDWDWDIPAVTLPALLFLGLVAGSGARGASRPGRPALGAPRARWRALALAGSTLWLAVFAISAELPELAASKASAALVTASGNSRAGLASAQSAAADAARLDPLSDAGPMAEATIALHRGQVIRARSYIQQALARDPSDERAWAQLAYIDQLLSDRPGVVAVSQRIIQLDPRGALARYVLGVQLLAANPYTSPSSIRTPLPRSTVATP